jgi:hypothetical protein
MFQIKETGAGPVRELGSVRTKYCTDDIQKACKIAA